MIKKYTRGAKKYYKNILPTSYDDKKKPKKRKYVIVKGKAYSVGDSGNSKERLKKGLLSVRSQFGRNAKQTSNPYFDELGGLI